MTASHRIKQSLLVKLYFMKQNESISSITTVMPQPITKDILQSQNKICSICSKIIIDNLYHCDTCNNIFHTLCILKRKISCLDRQSICPICSKNSRCKLKLLYKHILSI